MKEGTKVKVVACLTGHEFGIGQVVVRRYGEYEGDDNLGFYSEQDGLWYMKPDEYVIADTKAYALDLLKEALCACQDAKFSRGTIQAVEMAIENAQMELDND